MPSGLPIDAAQRADGKVLPGMRHRYSGGLFRMLELDVAASLMNLAPTFRFKLADNLRALHLCNYTQQNGGAKSALFEALWAKRWESLLSTPQSTRRSARSYLPVPSVTVRILSTPGTVKCSTLPLGQWISISSTSAAWPRPKCGRGSLVER